MFSNGFPPFLYWVPVWFPRCVRVVCYWFAVVCVPLFPFVSNSSLRVSTVFYCPPSACSIGFPLFVYCVSLWFLLCSPLFFYGPPSFFYGDPFIFLLGPLGFLSFSIAFSMEFEWIVIPFQLIWDGFPSLFQWNLNGLQYLFNWFLFVL